MSLRWPYRSYIVSLEYTSQFIRPSSHMTNKLCLQMVFDHFVCGFYLAIGLQMHRWRKITFYSKLCTQLLIFLIVKLLSIVSHDHNGYNIFADNVPLNEVTWLVFYDSCEGLCLYLLGEIVNGHNDMLSLCTSWRLRSDYIHLSLSEGPKAGDGH